MEDAYADMKVTLDPDHPEVFFDELDKFTVTLLRQMKFVTPEKVTELFNSVERTKKQVRDQLAAIKNTSL